MTSDDESVDATLNRYVGQAGEPPVGQVESSVDAVWERLRPEAECATLPARRIVTRRSSYFTVAAAVLVVTTAIGLYAVRRAGLLEVMPPIQQSAPPQVAPLSQSPSVSVNPVREPATNEAVAGSREPVGPSQPRQASAAAAPEAAVSQNTDAGAGPLPFAAAPARSPSFAFEVASIKLAPPAISSESGPWTVTNERFKAERGWVRAMVGWAYEVLPTQVKGGPDWLDREPYEVDAKAERSTAGPIRLMMRTLLMDRFKLAAHRETQQGPVYKLVLGKDGSKMQDANGGRKNYINWTGPGQVTFTENSTLQGLIGLLSTLLSAPVLDETGMRGSYTFSLSFKDPRDPRPRQADSPPDLIDAVQDQLGLRLEASTRPFEVIVIDHIERPSEN